MKTIKNSNFSDLIPNKKVIKRENIEKCRDSAPSKKIIRESKSKENSHLRSDLEVEKVMGEGGDSRADAGRSLWLRFMGSWGLEALADELQEAVPHLLSLSLSLWRSRRRRISLKWKEEEKGAHFGDLTRGEVWLGRGR